MDSYLPLLLIPALLLVIWFGSVPQIKRYMNDIKTGPSEDRAKADREKADTHEQAAD
ncbi:hypothetical protein ABIC16_003008 [Sphingomonas sp. PvP055]